MNIWNILQIVFVVAGVIFFWLSDRRFNEALAAMELAVETEHDAKLKYAEAEALVAKAEHLMKTEKPGANLIDASSVANRYTLWEMPGADRLFESFDIDSNTYELTDEGRLFVSDFLDAQDRPEYILGQPAFEIVDDLFGVLRRDGKLQVFTGKPEYDRHIETLRAKTPPPTRWQADEEPTLPRMNERREPTFVESLISPPSWPVAASYNPPPPAPSYEPSPSSSSDISSSFSSGASDGFSGGFSE